MDQYDFSLVLSKPSGLTDDMADALFAAGCDDATPMVMDGQICLDFSRSAPSYRDAVLSAIRDVHKSGIGADCVAVVGGPLIDLVESKMLDGARHLVGHQVTASNCNDSARNVVTALRGLWHALQPWVDHQLDQLDALAGDPNAGVDIATAIRNAVAPFLRSPARIELSQDDGA